MEQEHILNTHIDTLAKWWENAEEGIPSAGDTVIFDERHRGLGFHVTQAAKDHPRGYGNARILARAPKPAWHDALAVMARCSGAPEGHREPFIRSEATHDVWIAEAGCGRTENLRDVTPLIEAKVTDEMVKRLENHFLDSANMALPTGLARTMLTAALGLDPA